MRSTDFVIKFVNVLPGLEVAAASCQEVIVGVPVDAQHSRTDRFLDVLTHPPDDKQGKENMRINHKLIIKISISSAN